MALIKTDAPRRSRYARVAFCIFLAVAAFYLVTEHRAHLFGWLPYLIFLLCPLMHLFMHRSHPHGRGDDSNAASTTERQTPGHHHP
jgi:hypothetical protein